MKIGLLIAFAGRRCGGPEVYEREIVRALLAVKPQNEYHLYCLDKRASALIGVPRDRVTYHQVEPAFRMVSMTTSLPFVISRTRLDIFHAPVIPPPFCPANTIMAMPCSTLIRHPEFFPPLIRLRLRFLIHRAIGKAAKVICMSEHVREVMQEHFKLADDRLSVIYPGVSGSFRPIDESERLAYIQQHGIETPFFLVSGRWERRKNVIRTLEAFALFKRTYRTNHKLVFTGGHSWGSNEAKRVIQRLRLGETIVDLGQTSLEELPSLYGAADALVYASLWEGFGMPILEAMACGTPVITSDVAAMPETAGDSAILVDPNSTEQIAAAMYRVSTDTALRSRLREDGLKRAQQFSWDNAARRVLQLYEEIGESRKAAVASPA